jgi:hypothetical protein
MTLADSAGGCDFAISSDQTARDTTVFWAPEADTGVVLLSAAPSDLPTTAELPTTLRLRKLRRASDGLYLAHGHGRASVYSVVLGRARLNGPLAALVPLNASAPERLAALERLWRIAGGRPVSDRRLTPQRRLRLRNMLRAVDAKAVDASHREIANAIFGKRRVEAELWHASSLRFATMRLVRDGQAMIGGRYRELLGSLSTTSVEALRGPTGASSFQHAAC